jgi:hypothetical protein
MSARSSSGLSGCCGPQNGNIFTSGIAPAANSARCQNGMLEPEKWDVGVDSQSDDFCNDADRQMRILMFFNTVERGQ